METNLEDRMYSNVGNAGVIALVPRTAHTVLDVGCGAGDNAALLKHRDPDKQIFGITLSLAEQRAASTHMVSCLVGDLEAEIPAALDDMRFDALVFSHVLEHLRDPWDVLARYCALLKAGGTCVIAVPNVMFWRHRWRFLVGDFEYQETGTMDSTHLRFFSFRTAPRYLLERCPNLRLVHHSVTGGVPLGPIRHRLLSRRIVSAIDDLGARTAPNLFGDEILLQCVKTAEA